MTMQGPTRYEFTPDNRFVFGIEIKPRDDKYLRTIDENIVVDVDWTSELENSLEKIKGENNVGEALKLLRQIKSFWKSFSNFERKLKRDWTINKVLAVIKERSPAFMTF